MTFDVVILTYNSGSRLDLLLNSISKQSVRPNKIIIVDSQSIDDTLNIAKNYSCEVYVINKKDFDHGGTRTYALSFSNSDIVIYLTQDSLPVNQNTFENLIKVFDDDKIAAAFGKQIPYDNTNIFGKHLRYFNYPYFSYVRAFEDREKYGIKTCFLSNSFAAYRKNIVEKVGNFKNGLILGEDTYIGAKLLLSGYKIAYVSDALVYHSHSYSSFDEFKRYFDIGVFHKKENWILENFGKAEGEGFKYVFSGIKFLIKENKFYLILEFFLRIFLKYLGYKLGFNHKFLPKFLIKFCSMHKDWWNKNNQ